MPGIGSSTCFKTEYLKPTGLFWGQVNNIAIFRALTHKVNPIKFCVLIQY